MTQKGCCLMVIDTSAVMAILLGETEATDAVRLIADAGRCVMSAFSVLESSLVVTARKGPAGGRELDLLIHKAGIETVAFTAEHVELARAAWCKFGKGRHPAGLNIGDCCSYALSRYLGEPLLFKGQDFGQTDLEVIRLGP